MIRKKNCIADVFEYPNQHCHVGENVIAYDTESKKVIESNGRGWMRVLFTNTDVVNLNRLWVAANTTIVLVSHMRHFNNFVFVIDYLTGRMLRRHSVIFSRCGAKLSYDGRSFYMTSYLSGNIYQYDVMSGNKLHVYSFCESPEDVIELWTGDLLVAYCDRVSVFDKQGNILEEVAIFDWEESCMAFGQLQSDCVDLKFENNTAYECKLWTTSRKQQFILACVA